MSRVLFCGRGHGAGLRLLGDNLVFDFVVGGLRNDLFVHQIEFCAIGAAIDNFLGVDVTDAGQGLELVLGGSVEIELIASGGGASGHGLGGDRGAEGGV